ncbi:hypothetical protein [Nostoc sp.]|uniref:hypothetical protein n=1 Tax=Nostoc sp. TaxID=1180 RepID=UPI002FFBE83B
MKLSKLSKILGLTTAFAISSQATLLIQQNKAFAGTSTFTISSQATVIIQQNKVFVDTDPSVLNSGEYLFANQYLISPNGEYKAIEQSDGNFVLYDYNTPLWESKTDKIEVYYTVMQTDCNLVSYNFMKTPVWQSKTSGRGTNCRLQVQDDGNLVIYTGDNVPIWQTGTYR